MRDAVVMVYLAPRPEQFTPEQFRERWRRHFRLALARPVWANVLIYEQGDLIAEAAPTSLLQSEGIGGVAVASFGSRESFLAIRQAPDRHVMHDDELEVFGKRMDNEFIVSSDHSVLIDEGPPSHSIFTFLRRTDRDFRAERAGWTAQLRDREDLLQPLCRCVLMAGDDRRSIVAQYGFVDEQAFEVFLSTRLAALAQLERDVFRDAGIVRVATVMNTLLDRRPSP